MISLGEAREVRMCRLELLHALDMLGKFLGQFMGCMRHGQLSGL
jgi:hypothetical protein